MFPEKEPPRHSAVSAHLVNVLWVSVSPANPSELAMITFPETFQVSSNLLFRKTCASECLCTFLINHAAVH